MSFESQFIACTPLDPIFRFAGRPYASVAAERPKLSDPAHGTPRLQPRRSRRVRCSAWLGIISQMNQCFGMQKTSGYLLGSYRSATAPEPNSRRLTSFKSTYFDSPANNVGPWPASLGCTTNS
jgi:hypothetical protein